MVWRTARSTSSAPSRPRSDSAIIDVAVIVNALRVLTPGRDRLPHTCPAPTPRCPVGSSTNTPGCEPTSTGYTTPPPGSPTYPPTATTFLRHVHLGDDVPDTDDLDEFRRLLYGLHAILRLHFAQEEEGYFTLAELHTEPLAGPRGSRRVTAQAGVGRRGVRQAGRKTKPSVQACSPRFVKACNAPAGTCT